MKLSDVHPRLGIDLGESSTYRGIVMIIISVGIEVMDPAQLRWFLPIALAVIGCLGVFVKDKAPVFDDNGEDDEYESVDELIARGRR